MKRLLAGAATGALMILASASASAGQAQPAQGASTLTLGAEERAALLPLKQAVDARNWPLAASLIPAARTAMRSPDGRYVLGRLEIDVANGTQNRAAMNEGLLRALETRRGTNEEQADLLRLYAAMAYDSGSFNSAEGALNRALQLTPEDPETLSMLGQLNRNRNNNQQALTFFQRAARASEARGRPLPETRYKLGLAMAEQANQRGVAMEIARPFLAAYPSAVNWRDVLTIYRGGVTDARQNIEALRLMRAAGALAGERDYLNYVRTLAGVAAASEDARLVGAGLDQADAAAEAKAVLDEGIAAGMLSAQDNLVRTWGSAIGTLATRERADLAAQLAQARAATATATQARTVADTLLANGRHAEAAELYRLALLRTGEDQGLLNMRLGAALAMAGQRAEAEAALRAVTGPYADLAGLWAIWLARRPA